MKLNLSERVRANSEAAPWVIDEIKALEKELERLRAELAAAKKQFINDCIKHINKVALLNDCEFEGGMIADSVQEYFGDKQCL